MHVLDRTCQLEGLLGQLEDEQLPPPLCSGQGQLARPRCGGGSNARTCSGQSETEPAQQHPVAFDLRERASQPAQQGESWSVHLIADENGTIGDSWMRHHSVHFQAEQRAEKLAQLSEVSKQNRAKQTSEDEGERQAGRARTRPQKRLGVTRGCCGGREEER